jgi:hypothetical protein
MFKILFAIFVPGPTTLGIEVITKLDMAQILWGVRGRFALTQISLVASTEVLICVAILYEFARHSSHKADDDLPHSSEALERG